MNALQLLEHRRWYRFQELARYFIDGYNPKPSNFVVLLDMILSFPPILVPGAGDSPGSGRHFAHDFCRAASAALSGDDPARWLAETDGGDYHAILSWMRVWVKDHAPAPRPSDDD